MGQTRAEFEQIALEYMDLLYTQALRVGSNMEQAEKLIQLTFERAFHTFSAEDITDYKSWLLGILDHVTQKECVAS